MRRAPAVNRTGFDAAPSVAGINGQASFLSGYAITAVCGILLGPSRSTDFASTTGQLLDECLQHFSIR